MMRTRDKFFIGLGLGAVITVLTGWGRGLFTAADRQTLLVALCDGAFVAAVLLLGIGGLLWANNGGVFDGLGYSVKTLVARLRPGYEEARESFADYRARRAEKSSAAPWMLPAGLCYLAAALALMFFSAKV